MDDLKALALFWESIADQDTTRFSDGVLKKLFVLNYAPGSPHSNIINLFGMFYYKNLLTFNGL